MVHVTALRFIHRFKTILPVQLQSHVNYVEHTPFFYTYRPICNNLSEFDIGFRNFNHVFNQEKRILCFFYIRQDLNTIKQIIMLNKF